MIRRALRRECPRCGGDGIFASFMDLHERCPTCGVRFEREPGYWVGAMIIVTTITFSLFLLLLVGGMVVTWPDVPWTALLVITVTVNLIVPIVAYPRSKTLWSAMELGWHPLEREELESAAAHAPSSGDPANS